MPGHLQVIAIYFFFLCNLNAHWARFFQVVAMFVSEQVKHRISRGHPILHENVWACYFGTEFCPGGLRFGLLSWLQCCCDLQRPVSSQAHCILVWYDKKQLLQSPNTTSPYCNGSYAKCSSSASRCHLNL